MCSAGPARPDPTGHGVAGRRGAAADTTIISPFRRRVGGGAGGGIGGLELSKHIYDLIRKSGVVTSTRTHGVVARLGAWLGAVGVRRPLPLPCLVVDTQCGERQAARRVSAQRFEPSKTRASCQRSSRQDVTGDTNYTVTRSLREVAVHTAPAS